ARNHVAITTLDNSYYPTALVLPFEGNARQSQLESTFNTIKKGSTEGVMILEDSCQNCTVVPANGYRNS
ncbi:MAG: hypothetical protein PUI82_04520, partial [Firmicutes bacterium]|nr:hypothetical protein [Bacillota bacterium]